MRKMIAQVQTSKRSSCCPWPSVRFKLWGTLNLSQPKGEGDVAAGRVGADGAGALWSTKKRGSAYHTAAK